MDTKAKEMNIKVNPGVALEELDVLVLPTEKVPDSVSPGTAEKYFKFTFALGVKKLLAEVDPDGAKMLKYVTFVIVKVCTLKSALTNSILTQVFLGADNMLVLYLVWLFGTLMASARVGLLHLESVSTW